MKRQLLISVLLFTSAFLGAQIIHVPDDYPTIQEGIDAAGTGDTVLVDTGTYYENINFLGKAITVASHFILDGDTNHINNTVINGSQPAHPDSAACVMFVHGEDTTSILNGFTLTGGSGVWTAGFNIRSGGGVFAYESGAKVMYNKIMYNQVESDSGGGAGLEFLGGDNYWAVIDNNTISHNSSISDGYSAFGAGMSILVNAVIKNNIIEHNTCTNTDQMADGGGIELELWAQNSNQYAFVRNNIIRHNTLNGTTFATGAGIMSIHVPCEITNNDIYDNAGNADDFGMGGGVRILSSDSKVIVDNNEIHDNTLAADRVQGGGIDIGLAAELAILSNNNVYNNEINGTTAAWGAGMSFVKNYDMIITNNNVHDNSISGGSWWCGAGIYHERAYNSMEISNNIIKDNVGTGTSYGGGIGLYDVEGASYSLTSNLIMGNHCNYGAGLWTFNTYDISLTNNIFIENVASWSGGAYALRQNTKDYPDNISIAGTCGEIISLKDNPSKGLHPVVVNNTFYNNSSDSLGGAIHSDQNTEFPLFFNNIFWQNNAGYGDDIYYNGPDTLIIENCDINISSDTNIVGHFAGHGNIYEDPGFDAGDSLCCIHGGPCHNAGIGELIFRGINYPAPEFDYGGTPRPQGEDWDIGADECIMIRLTDIISDDQNIDLLLTPNPTSSRLAIQYTIKERKEVSLILFNMQGGLVESIRLGEKPAGDHRHTLNLSHLPGGVYLLRLEAGEEAETAKVILLK